MKLQISVPSACPGVAGRLFEWLPRIRGRALGIDATQGYREARNPIGLCRPITGSRSDSPPRSMDLSLYFGGDSVETVPHPIVGGPGDVGSTDVVDRLVRHMSIGNEA